MKASEARKRALEMAPIQEEKDRKAAAAAARRKAEEEAKKAAEEHQKLMDRYAQIVKQIEWAVNRGKTSVEVGIEYKDDKVALFKLLHADGYKAYEGRTYFTDYETDNDGYPTNEFTNSRQVYRIEW